MSGPSIHSRTRLFIVLSSLVAGSLAAPAAQAQWTAAPRTVVTATGTQQGAVVAPGTANDLFLAWTDKRADRDVYVQRVDSLGNVAAAGGVAVGSGATPQHSPSVAPDGAGGVLVAWVDSSGVVNDVYAQRFNAALAPQWGAGGVRVCTAAGHQVLPVVASDDSGGAFVVWEDLRNGPTNSDIYAQRIRANGALAWSASGVVLCGATGMQVSPRLVRDGAHGVVSCWDDHRNGSATVTQTFLQRLNPAGLIVWENNGTALDPGSAIGTLLACDASGNTLACFADVVGTGTGVHLFRFGPDGNRNFADTTARATVSSTAGYLPFGLVPQSGGGTLCLYGSATSIRARVMGSNGPPPASSFALAAPAAATSVVTSSDGADGAWLTWVDGSQVRAQHVTSGSTLPLGASGVAVAATSASRTRSGASHIVLPTGELEVAWEDAPTGAAADTELVAQHVAPTGLVGEYYRLWVSVGAHGAVTPSGLVYVAAHSSPLLNALADPGYHIDTVLADGASIGPVPNFTFTDVTAHHTYSAAFSNALITRRVITTANTHVSLSLPIAFTPDTVSAVLAPLWPPAPERWRFGRWDPVAKLYQTPSTTLKHVRPGEGYWLATMVADTLDFTGAATPEQVFLLTLAPTLLDSMGWNQIGNPHRFSVAVSTLEVRSGAGSWQSFLSGQVLTGHEVLGWTPSGGYAAVTALAPGQAYWVHKETGTNVSLSIPFVWSQGASPGAQPGLPSGAAWAIDISATQAGGPGATLELGAGDVSDGAWNALCAARHPASPARDLSMWVSEGAWGARSGDYSAHFRADGAALSWDVQLRGEDALAQAAVAFAFRGLPGDRVVTLSDPVAGWSRRVRDGERVPLALASSGRTLRVSVTSDGAPVLESGVAGLRALAPNPFAGRAALSFALPVGGDVTVDVLDVSGRRVTLIARRGLAPGEHVVEWDGRDASGRQVRPGVYLARWSAGGRTGAARLVAVR